MEEAGSISGLLCSEAIRLELRSTTFEHVVRELLALIARAVDIGDMETALKAVLEREELMGTGVGKGIAIPHASLPGIGQVCAALGMSSIGVDFDTPDGRSVVIVFLLLFPEEDYTGHIHILAQLSRVFRLKGIRQQLLTAKTSTEAVRMLTEAEKRLAPNHAV